MKGKGELRESGHDNISFNTEIGCLKTYTPIEPKYVWGEATHNI